MALGLGRLRASNEQTGNTLLSLLRNPVGFPAGYLPKIREMGDDVYIETVGTGRDSNNKVVFFKWIFIDPTDLSATPDSEMEYAALPKTGCIMRIMQRSLLPYHENFIIDYYEDINNMKIITINGEHRDEFQNKINHVTRSFRYGDVGVPAELKTEIFSYPEIFFNTYLRDTIPLDLYYTGSRKGSNHISDYGGNSGVSLDLGIQGITNRQISSTYQPGTRPRNPTGVVMNPKDLAVDKGRVTTLNSSAYAAQQRINDQIAAKSNEAVGTPTDKSFHRSGLHHRTW